MAWENEELDPGGFGYGGFGEGPFGGATMDWQNISDETTNWTDVTPTETTNWSNVL